MTVARRRRPFSGGFTLLELVIALALLALLVTMAAPVFQVNAQRQKEAELRAVLREIRGAIDAFKRASDEGRIAHDAEATGYPATLRMLVEGVADARDPRAARLYFLRRVPRDPLHADGTAPAEETWGLRSYASPPDAPAPGDDVFDVYSLSPQRALDGSYYRDW